MARISRCDRGQGWTPLRHEWLSSERKRSSQAIYPSSHPRSRSWIVDHGRKPIRSRTSCPSRASQVCKVGHRALQSRSFDRERDHQLHPKAAPDLPSWQSRCPDVTSADVSSHLRNCPWRWSVIRLVSEKKDDRDGRRWRPSSQCSISSSSEWFVHWGPSPGSQYCTLLSILVVTEDLASLLLDTGTCLSMVASFRLPSLWQRIRFHSSRQLACTRVDPIGHQATVTSWITAKGLKTWVYGQGDLISAPSNSRKKKPKNDIRSKYMWGSCS